MISVKSGRPVRIPDELIKHYTIWAGRLKSYIKT
jgi:hypothetical protein